MRATEFIDFLTRKDLKGVENYSHLEVRKENENGEMVIKKKYLKLRKEYQKREKKHD